MIIQAGFFFQLTTGVSKEKGIFICFSVPCTDLLCTFTGGAAAALLFQLPSFSGSEMWQTLCYSKSTWTAVSWTYYPAAALKLEKSAIEEEHCSSCAKSFCLEVTEKVCSLCPTLNRFVINRKWNTVNLENLNMVAKNILLSSSHLSNCFISMNDSLEAIALQHSSVLLFFYNSDKYICLYGEYMMAGDTYSLTVKSVGNDFTKCTTSLTCRLVRSLYRVIKFCIQCNTYVQIWKHMWLLTGKQANLFTWIEIEAFAMWHFAFKHL